MYRLLNEQLIRAPVHNLSKFPIRRIFITLAINFHENIIKVREVPIDVAILWCQKRRTVEETKTRCA